MRAEEVQEIFNVGAKASDSLDRLHLELRQLVEAFSGFGEAVRSAFEQAFEALNEASRIDSGNVTLNLYVEDTRLEIRGKYYKNNEGSKTDWNNN